MDALISLVNCNFIASPSNYRCQLLRGTKTCMSLTNCISLPSSRTCNLIWGLLWGTDACMPSVNAQTNARSISVWDATRAHAEAIQCVTLWRFTQQGGPPQAENFGYSRVQIWWIYSIWTRSSTWNTAFETPNPQNFRLRRQFLKFFSEALYFFCLRRPPHPPISPHLPHQQVSIKFSTLCC